MRKLIACYSYEQTSFLLGEAISSDVNGKFNNDLENITKRIYNSNSNTLMQLLGGSAPGLSKRAGKHSELSMERQNFFISLVGQYFKFRATSK